MNILASEIKKLRDETDAPFMECKAALTEAEGDFDKARAILREKGKAVAVKRAGYSTSAGVIAFARSEDKKTVSGVVLECETDFVARNEDFIKLADEIAQIFLVVEPGENPTQASHNGKNVESLIVEGVTKIRENIKLTQSIRIVDSHPIAFYVHHDKMKGCAVTTTSDDERALEVGRQVAIQSVAFPPEYLSKDEVSKDQIEKELEIETQRAVNEGKSPDIARNIAQGRINKEFMKRVVLLEQPFYKDPTKSVSDYIKEESKNINPEIAVTKYIRLSVNQ